MVAAAASKNVFLGKLYLDVACFNTANHLSGIVNRINLTKSQLVHCQEEIDSLRMRLDSNPLGEKLLQICKLVEPPLILDDAFFEKLYTMKQREIEEYLDLLALLYEKEVEQQKLFARQFNLQEHASEERIIKFFENIHKIIDEIKQQIENLSKQLEDLKILQIKLNEFISTCRRMIDDRFSKVVQEYVSDNKITTVEWKNNKYNISKSDIATTVSKIISEEIKAGGFVSEITQHHKHRAIIELIRKIMPETSLSDSIVKSIGSKIEKEVESFGRFLNNHHEFNEINKLSIKMNNAVNKLKIVDADIDLKNKTLNLSSSSVSLLEDKLKVYKSPDKKIEENIDINEVNDLERVVNVIRENQKISSCSLSEEIVLEEDELILDDEDMSLSNENVIEENYDPAKKFNQVTNPIISERRSEIRPTLPSVSNENTHNENHEHQANLTPRGRI